LEPASAQTGTSPDVMAMLLAMVGSEKEAVTSSSVSDETPAEQPKESGKEEGNDLQNVDLFAAGLQMVTMQQINGRMPEPGNWWIIQGTCRCTIGISCAIPGFCRNFDGFV